MEGRIGKIANYTLFVLFIGLSSAVIGEEVPTASEIIQPLKPVYKNSALYRWSQKQVLVSRSLLDMDAPPDLQEHAKVVKRQGKTGDKCLQLSSPRGFGIPFDNVDWTDYNRISFWVYPEQTTEHGIMYVAFSLEIDPNDYPKGRMVGEYWSSEFFVRPNQWNPIVWEIPHLNREKVKGLHIAYTNQLTWPDGQMDVTVYVDDIKLEKVEIDNYQGWEVGKDKIAYSHLGYKPNLSKTAIGSTLEATEFEVIDAKNGKSVLKKDIELVESKIGKFQLLDFSEVRTPGTYKLKAGDYETRSFKIEEDIWKEAVWKALNYYYCQRVSTEIPWYQPFHCNQDVQSFHPDTPHLRRLVPGGWYDAGDLSQWTEQTAPITYLLFEYADKIAKEGGDQKLYDRIIEEGKWGLDWLLKTNFGDGYRTNLIWYYNNFTIKNFSNGIPGDQDDPVRSATNCPLKNFMVSAAEIQAYKVLKDSDPNLARHALNMAEEDWKQAVLKEEEWMNDVGGHYRHHKNMNTGDLKPITGSEKEVGGGVGGAFIAAAWGIIATTELFEIIQDPIYKNKAIEYGRLLMSCQEKTFLHDVPIAGYFYTHPSKTIRVQDGNGGRSEVPINAIRKLAETFPDSGDWIDWYCSLLMHSEYFTKQIEGTAPYDLSPVSVYKDTDYLLFLENIQSVTKRMVEEGTKIDDHFYLRYFPTCQGVMNGTSGNTLQNGTISACVAHVRGDLESEELAQKQLQWVLGRNPFSKSMAYDIGYDYQSDLSFSKGAMVGAFLLGIDSLHNDGPYWSSSSYFTSKESYVGTTYRFWHAAMLLSSPAYVTGKVKPVKGEAVIFTNQTTGEKMTAKVNESGDFNVSLPFGLYTVQCDDLERTLAIVSGKHYTLRLNPEETCDFNISTKTNHDTITIELTARGNGKQRFKIKAFNLDIPESQMEISFDLQNATSFKWRAKIIDANMPWVAVVIPNGDNTWQQEAFGQVKFTSKQ